MTDLSELAKQLETREEISGDAPQVGTPSRLARITDPSSRVPTYVGVLAVLVGFALIGIAWAKIAGLTDVWKQMPYLVSTGFTGLGLIMTGLVVVNVAARRQDGAQRERQLGQLNDALQELQRALDEK